MILAAQVSYNPQCIPALAETLTVLLAPGGEVWLYNDRVSYTSDHTTCRALLVQQLAKHALIVTEGAHCGLHLPDGFGERSSEAYLLRITRHDGSAPSRPELQGTQGA